jgi:hypothetical protein
MTVIVIVVSIIAVGVLFPRVEEIQPQLQILPPTEHSII